MSMHGSPSEIQAMEFHRSILKRVFRPLLYDQGFGLGLGLSLVKKGDG